MKKLLIYAVLIFSIFSWSYYSNPNHSLSPEETEAVIEAVNTILNDPELHEKPVLTIGRITHSISTRFAGFCTLAYQGREILVLSRDFTPPTGAIVACLVIPKRVFGVGHQYFTVAALIEYKQLEKWPDTQELFLSPEPADQSSQQQKIKKLSRSN